jgi:hypothetical protein
MKLISMMAVLLAMSTVASAQEGQPTPMPAENSPGVALPTQVEASPNNMPSDGPVFITFLGGFSFAASSDDNNDDVSKTYTQFNYGGRIGVNLGSLSDFHEISIAGSIDHYTVTDSAFSGVSENFTAVQVQFLFRKLYGGGFYFGPELGVELIKETDSFGDNQSASLLTGGVLGGYEFTLAPNITFAPEIHADTVAGVHNDNFDQDKVSELKMLLALTITL